MAHIAFLDHSYHRRTLSTGFLPEILERHGHRVDWFWDEAWTGGPPIPWEALKDHDVVIMFQSFCTPPAAHFCQAHPNVIYIPMLDQFGFWLRARFNLASFWEPFQGSKVLNFSQSLHHVVSGHGIYSFPLRYFQPPAATTVQSEGLHGFFWLRRENKVPWATIRALVGETRFDSFHIHMVPDPGSPTPTPPSPEDIATLGMTTSTWLEDKAELNALIDRANVYFAPRPGEGIGQSFLEAMARGACIVAPDQGTMNEYILHGVNGLLYDLDAPQALDFSGHAGLGRMARQTVEAGHRRWLEAEAALVDFILTPSANLYRGGYTHPGLMDAASSRQRRSSRWRKTSKAFLRAARRR